MNKYYVGTKKQSELPYDVVKIAHADIENTCKAGDYERTSRDYLNNWRSTQARVSELEAENARLKQERKVVEDYCWSKAGGKISVAGTIYRYLSEGIKIPQQGENRDE